MAQNTATRLRSFASAKEEGPHSSAWRRSPCLTPMLSIVQDLLGTVQVVLIGELSQIYCRLLNAASDATGGAIALARLEPFDGRDAGTWLSRMAPFSAVGCRSPNRRLLKYSNRRSVSIFLQLLKLLSTKAVTIVEKRDVGGHLTAEALRSALYSACTTAGFAVPGESRHFALQTVPQSGSTVP